MSQLSGTCICIPYVLIEESSARVQRLGCVSKNFNNKIVIWYLQQWYIHIYHVYIYGNKKHMDLCYYKGVVIYACVPAKDRILFKFYCFLTIF